MSRYLKSKINNKSELKTIYTSNDKNQILNIVYYFISYSYSPRMKLSHELRVQSM